MVYRLTIQETVEERIFALQNQKRELATAALEGKAIAKLSMNELLNLFKHDDDHYVKGSKLGEFMLGAKAPVPKTSTHNTSSVTGSEMPGHKPRIQERQKPSSRPEHEIYGRRW